MIKQLNIIFKIYRIKIYLYQFNMNRLYSIVLFHQQVTCPL